MAWTEQRTGGYIGRYRDTSGRTRSTKLFTRKRYAQEAADAQENLVKRGEWADPSRGRVMFGAWADQWRDTLRVKPKTLVSYESLLRSLVMPEWSAVRLDQITLKDVKKWVANMSGVNGRNISASRVRQAHRVFAAILDLAVEDGRLAKNPAHSSGRRDTFLPKVRKQKPHRFLSHDEVRRLAGATPEHYRPMVLFLAYTGLRWGEAAALRIGDVDMLRRRVHVSRSVAEVNGRLDYGTTKTHASRSVPFPAFLAEDFARLMDGRGRDDLVFVNASGGALRVGNFRRRAFDKAVTVAGVAPLTPHDLRHTAASLAVQAGATVKGVQLMLGHEDASLTLNTYAGLFEDDLDRVAERLGEAAARTASTVA